MLGVRRVAPVVLLLLALLVPCGCAEQGEDTVRVGYLRDDPHQLAYYVAREKGYFSERGLEVEEKVYNSGPEEMSAFSAGDLDVGYVEAAAAITFAGQGMTDVKIVAEVSSEGSALLVRPGLEGEDLNALEGRTIAVPGFSTVQELILRLALEKARMDPERVRIVALKPAETLAALTSAQADACMVSEPYPATAEAGGEARVLLRSREIWPEHPCSVLVVDSEFLRRYPDTVKRMVAAHIEATEYIQENRLEAVDMVRLFTDQSKDVAEKALDDIEYDYVPDPRKLEQYVGFLEQKEVIDIEGPRKFTEELLHNEFLHGGK